VTLYTSALELCPNAILYANRAAAHLALENYGSALADAQSSVQLDAQYIKGYYRRAAARFLLGKPADALRDYRLVRFSRPAARASRADLGPIAARTAGGESEAERQGCAAEAEGVRARGERAALRERHRQPGGQGGALCARALHSCVCRLTRDAVVCRRILPPRST
jgi:tetratricopeptide (TPR) repeat protein